MLWTRCPSKQLAPEIVRVKTLPGGWRVVVTKKVIGVALPSTLDDIARSSLKEAVDTLRPQNILMTKFSNIPNKRSLAV